MIRTTTTALLTTATLAVATLGLTACGDDGPAVVDQRVEQIRDAAAAAGLPSDVTEVLALAARGSSATFRITYAGTDGATIVVAQAPPDRRIDIISAGRIIESRVLRDGVGYACTIPDKETALRCERKAGSLRTEGAFTDVALQDFTANLAGSKNDVDLKVESRTIAGVEASCLITTPKAGSPLTGSGPGAETICLSPEGAQLLVDAGDDKVTATEYGTDIPKGTFDVDVGDPDASGAAG